MPTRIALERTRLSRRRPTYVDATTALIALYAQIQRTELLPSIYADSRNTARSDCRRVSRLGGKLP